MTTPNQGDKITLVVTFPDDWRRDEMATWLEQLWPDLSYIAPLEDGEGVLGHLPISGLCDRCHERPHANWTHHKYGKLCDECWDETCGDLPPCAFGPVQMPDNEELSRLVADANVCEEDA